MDYQADNLINSDLIGNIYDAFVTAGITPTAKIPDALVAAVTTLKNNSVHLVQVTLVVQ